MAIEKDIKRLNIDIDKELWRLVSVKAAEKGVTKRGFVEMALVNQLRLFNDQNSIVKLEK